MRIALAKGKVFEGWYAIGIEFVFTGSRHCHGDEEIGLNRRDE